MLGVELYLLSHITTILLPDKDCIAWLQDKLEVLV